jgi:hypothetical protein
LVGFDGEASIFQMFRVFVFLCGLCGADLAVGAETGSFDLQVWCAEAGRAKPATNEQRMVLGKALYVAPTEFATNHQAKWLAQAGADMMTLTPLAMLVGESNGIDLSSNVYATNRAVEQFPIPKNLTGLFWRFHSEKGTKGVSLKCEFTYNARDEDDGTIARKAHYVDTLTFRSNEVAVIRLPQVTEIQSSPRRILGISAGKTKEPLTREFYLAVQFAPKVETEK